MTTPAEKDESIPTQMEERLVKDLYYNNTKQKFMIEIQSIKSRVATKIGYLTSKLRMHQIIQTIRKAKKKRDKGICISREEARIIQLYDITDGKDPKVIEVKYATTGVSRVYLAPEDSFDIIFQIHKSTDHCGAKEIKKETEKRYLIHPKCYEILISACSVCQKHKQESKTQMKIKKKWYVFLHTVGTPDPPFQYIMVVRDLGTQFTHLRPLTSLTVTEIALELLKISTDVGPPDIIESKPAKYFKDICNVITTMCPQFNIDVERRESAPYLAWAFQVKSFLSDWSKTNDTSNWSLGCHIMQWTINNSNDKISLSGPHKALFGRNIFSKNGTFNSRTSTSKQSDVDDVVVIDEVHKSKGYTVTLSSVNEKLARLGNHENEKIPPLTWKPQNVFKKASVVSNQPPPMPNLITEKLPRDNVSVTNIMTKTQPLSLETVINSFLNTPQTDSAKTPVETETFSLDAVIDDMINSGTSTSLQDINATSSIVSIQTYPLKSLLRNFRKPQKPKESNNILSSGTGLQTVPVNNGVSDSVNAEKVIQSDDITLPVISHIFSLDSEISEMVNNGEVIHGSAIKNAGKTTNDIPSDVEVEEVMSRNYSESVVNQEENHSFNPVINDTKSLAPSNQAVTSDHLLNKKSSTDSTLQNNLFKPSGISDNIATDTSTPGITANTTVTKNKETELTFLEACIQSTNKMEEDSIFIHANGPGKSFQDAYTEAVTKTTLNPVEILQPPEQVISATPEQNISSECVMNDLTDTETTLRDENAKITLVSVEFSDDEDDVRLSEIKTVCGYCKVENDNTSVKCQRCNKTVHRRCSRELKVKRKRTTCFKCLLRLRKKLKLFDTKYFRKKRSEIDNIPNRRIPLMKRLIKLD